VRREQHGIKDDKGLAAIAFANQVRKWRDFSSCAASIVFGGPTDDEAIALQAGSGTSRRPRTRLPRKPRRIAGLRFGHTRRATCSSRQAVERSADDKLETFRAELEQAGHSVATATGQPAAVEVAAFFRPDVALIDLGDTKVDRQQIGRRIRLLRRCRGAYLVALTGDEPSDSRRHVKPFDAHLAKAVSGATVLALVAHLRLRQD